MPFEDAKSKNLKQIIETELKDAWSVTTFQKLVDAKIGLELTEAINKLINSNEKLADSAKKYSRVLCYLTGGLVFVGLLQFIALLIPLIQEFIKKG